ncbi:ankyrin repeat domain-containing protein [Nonomuraea sp. C10]|uniref:ankyrin repeat domain-containing protein n=1 Tax=Nonomuraea sp. C10 TaxID=2600577 RepID=UPI0011CE51AE|nr:ankyrin repeat domain-containing protein [Nonomuraea sp. C10]TXK40345.1 ankyrin repeat domain-containing protein [Nonomuraea sp. C10]
MIWDGITLRPGHHEAGKRDALADAARHGDWDAVFALLGEHPGWVNSGRLGGATWYAPLHQAAWRGAAPEAVRRLVALGAWRTLRTASGERAVDVARRKGHRHLVEPLTPAILHPVPEGTLATIQRHFHGLIRQRAEDLVTLHRLRLPELEPLTEQADPSCWFPVPGMYGGFGYRLEPPGLVVESWCRVVGGSGQRHAIDEGGVRLLDEGFV